MATRAYAGVGGKARKVKRIYIGVNGKARSVKKVYVGVNGKARLCWMRPGLYKLSSNIRLYDSVYKVNGGSLNDYAVFGGGYNNNNPSGVKKVRAYNNQLTSIDLTDFGYERYRGAAGSNGNHILFAGGDNNDGKTTEGYDNNLTKISSIQKLSAPAYYNCGNNIGSVIVFMSGSVNKNDTLLGFNKYSAINFYNDNLSYYYKEGPTDLTLMDGASAVIGKYLLYAGGAYKTILAGNSYKNSVFAITTDGIMSNNPSPLSDKSDLLTGVSNDKYALFAGGYNGEHTLDIINVYNNSLTKLNSITLSQRCYALSSTFLDNKFIFAGGFSSSTIDVYDDSLTRVKFNETLSMQCAISTSAKVGMYSLFAGTYGRGISDNNSENNTYLNTIEVLKSV